ncbi:MAG: hypothetical protein AT711_05090 [Thermoproteus sp. CIS_19]|nr:MAG: hypothetical protein AT711_05090 [Thermoproteus sp. CIS_19]MCI4464731.1 hypothetical protein [Thermoproteus sp.]
MRSHFGDFVESIKIRPETKRRLIKYRARLEAELGRKVSLDEAIARLLESAESRDFAKFLKAVERARSRAGKGELVGLLKAGRGEDEAGG